MSRYQSKSESDHYEDCKWQTISTESLQPIFDNTSAPDARPRLEAAQSIPLYSSGSSPVPMPVIQAPDAVHDHPFMRTIQGINQGRNRPRDIEPGEYDRVDGIAAYPGSSANEISTKYNVDEEVHLLDSDGNEQSGLATYIITSIIEPEHDRRASNSDHYNSPSFVPLDSTFPPLSTTPGMQSLYSGNDLHRQSTNKHISQPSQTLYTLTPALHTKFRTSHSRLLPVGFALGTEVRQHEYCFSALVIRRTVLHGKRYYDLKDELELIWKDVPEEELTVTTGGSFDFRIINRS